MKKKNYSFISSQWSAVSHQRSAVSGQRSAYFIQQLSTVEQALAFGHAVGTTL
ncbi:MAG: hypothetical protein F6K55_36460 [Moorea sp. SIO4A3]|nr:hypothetical protein [Moorena sp. SIO4A3]